MTHMGIDQYGRAEHDLGPHPRAELLRRLDRKRAERMYVDTKHGARHIGWIIGGRWFTVYRVERMEGRVHFSTPVVAKQKEA
jgi:hypothetical protein